MTTKASGVGRFDPEEAKKLLKEFLDAGADVPEHHPLYPLYIQYSEWEEKHEAAVRDYSNKLGADNGVKRDEARAILAIGALDSDDDYMLVHTRQALRLFVGRGRVHIPAQFRHTIQSKPATRSDPKPPPIPIQSRPIIPVQGRPPIPIKTRHVGGSLIAG